MDADPELQEEAGIMHHVLIQLSRFQVRLSNVQETSLPSIDIFCFFIQEDRQLQAGQKWKLPPNGQPISLFSGNATNRRTIIHPDDDGKHQILNTCNLYTLNASIFYMITVIFRVYCADHTYCTLRFPMCTTAETIKACAAEKLQINRISEDLLLVELKSNGEKSIFKDHDVGIPTAITLNGRIFVAPKDQIEVLV